MSASKFVDSGDDSREMYIHTSSNFDSIVSGLKQFQNLHNLRINFSSPEEELLLIEKLENLDYLNDTKIVRQNIHPKSGLKSTQRTGSKYAKSLISKTKLSELARNTENTMKQNTSTGQDAQKSPENSLSANKEVICYKKIFAFVKDFLNSGNTRVVDRGEFNGFLKNIEVDYQDSLKNSSYDFVSNTLLTMAQFSLHNFCYVRALDILKDIDSGVHTIFKVLHENLNNYIREYFQGVLGLEGFVSGLKKNSEKRKNDAMAHTNDILSKAETLVKENEETLMLYEKDKSDWEQLKKSLTVEIKILEKENKKMLDKMIASGKHRADTYKDSQTGEATGKKAGKNFN
jgi:hypothetical protein